MRAVVIGSGRGFGAEVCVALRRRKVEVVGVSRSHTEGVDFVCDVFDHELLTSVMSQILYHRGPVDALFCVAGHVNPKPSCALRPQDWNAAWRINVGYVTVAWHALRASLEASQAPILATIGSHWSTRVGCDMLTPHIVTKSALLAYTQELAASHKGLAANHYCVPAMDTPRFRELAKLGLGKFFPHGKVAVPKRVAECVVKLAFARQQGVTYVVRRDGSAWITS